MTQRQQYDLDHLQELNKKAQSRIEFWKRVSQTTSSLLLQMKVLDKMLDSLDDADEHSNDTQDYDSSDDDKSGEESADNRTTYKFKDCNMRQVKQEEDENPDKEKLFYTYDIFVDGKVVNSGKTSGHDWYNAMVRATHQKYYGIIQPALKKKQKVKIGIKSDKTTVYYYYVL